MAKKRYVKLEQGRYNVSLSRAEASYEASKTGESCIYCGNYYPNARKSIAGRSFACDPCLTRAICR